MAEAQHIYQAIGELLATLVVASDGTKSLHTGSEQYPVFIPRHFENKYNEKYQGQQVYWRVYPKATEFRLHFSVVMLALSPKYGAGQFNLQGDWIENGQLKIWRNASASIVNTYNWRPRLLPINWPSSPAPDQAFWQLKAQLVNGALEVVEAAGPFPHPPRLEHLQDSNLQQQQRQQQPRHAAPKPPIQAKQQAAINTQILNWEDITPVSGNLELTIKFNTMPQVIQANGRCHFKIDCSSQVFQVSMKPKLWAKLETANSSYEQWVAALSGKLGAATADGFVLEEPNIQVFERHSKTGDSSKQAPAPSVETSAPEQEQAAGSSSAQVEAKTKTAPTVLVNAAAQSVVKPSEKSGTLDPLTRPADSTTEAKPKKIGKFKVEVR